MQRQTILIGPFGMVNSSSACPSSFLCCFWIYQWKKDNQHQNRACIYQKVPGGRLKRRLGKNTFPSPTKKKRRKWPKQKEETQGRGEICTRILFVSLWKQQDITTRWLTHKAPCKNMNDDNSVGHLHGLHCRHSKASQQRSQSTVT